MTNTEPRVNIYNGNYPNVKIKQLYIWEHYYLTCLEKEIKVQSILY